MAQAHAADPTSYLYGHGSLKHFLGYMTSRPVDAHEADTRRLSDDWRVAHEHARRLRRSEASWADEPPVYALPHGMAALVHRVHADPFFQKTFSYVPVEIGLVELDRLVVCQNLTNLTQVERLKAQLGPRPSQEQVFRACLPYDHPTPPHQLARLSGRTFAFASDTNDLRFLDAVALGPEHLAGYQAFGPIAGVVALVVGYGSNYLNVLSLEGRLVLNNGNHRAYALHELGVFQVPCVIQKISDREELNVLAHHELRRYADDYLREPRPPVLKDYFDPKLSRVVHLPRTSRHIRVSYSVEEIDMP